MISTALLLNVITIGLVVAVIIPAIDVALQARRMRGFAITKPDATRLATPRAIRKSACGTGAPTRPFALMHEDRRHAGLQRSVGHTDSPGLRARTPGIRSRAKRRPVSERSSLGRVRRTSSYATTVASYVTSNGLTLTPNVRSAAVITARRACHPHAEYWRYGSPEFYAYA